MVKSKGYGASDRDQVQAGTGVESGCCPPRLRAKVVADFEVAVDADKSDKLVVEFVGIYPQYPSSTWNYSSRFEQPGHSLRQ